MTTHGQPIDNLTLQNYYSIKVEQSMFLSRFHHEIQAMLVASDAFIGSDERLSGRVR